MCFIILWLSLIHISPIAFSIGKEQVSEEDGSEENAEITVQLLSVSYTHLVLWLTSGNSALGAVRQFSTEVDNEVMTGDISISIQEYQWNEEGERVPYIDGKRVVPNEKAVKIVTIVNEAEPAWIRAKAEFSGFAGTAGGEAVSYTHLKVPP